MEDKSLYQQDWVKLVGQVSFHYTHFAYSYTTTNIWTEKTLLALASIAVNPITTKTKTRNNKKFYGNFDNNRGLKGRLTKIHEQKYLGMQQKFEINPGADEKNHRNLVIK